MFYCKLAAAPVLCTQARPPVIYIYPVDPNLCKYRSSHKFASWGVCRWWHFTSRGRKQSFKRAENIKMCFNVILCWIMLHVWCLKCCSELLQALTRLQSLFTVFFFSLSFSGSLLENMTSVKVAGQALQCGPLFGSSFIFFSPPVACWVEEEF